MDSSLQIAQLLIFAALAAVVLFNLYAVLGKRVGRQPEEVAAPQAVLAPAPEAPPDALGLGALRAREPGFDPMKFLAGARSAYETIVKAFASGDRDTLRGLTTPNVFAIFDAAIHQRETEGRTEQVEFLNAPRADLEAAEVASDLARLKVRFLSEFRSRTKDQTGEGVDDRRAAEVWTFERPLGSQDPNWVLAQVEAAEA
jgi:predicted lipid-binding transport protein (Tim44 family)